MNENYEILGIDKNASIDEIKRAYKQLAKKYHPDYNKNPNANEKFIEINKAYKEVLNPKARTFFGIEIWESIIKKEDFNIPSINYVELEKAEKERDKLKKIYETEGIKLRNNLEKEFKKLYGKFYASSKNERDFYGELTKLKPISNYYEACRKCAKIKNAPYKEYKWAINKLKFLSKLYQKITIYKESINDIIGMDILISHFKRLLNKEIDIKEKITKPENMITKPIEMIQNFRGNKVSKYYEFEVKQIKKLVFDIQNQFHPKFLNKFPGRIQIFLQNKIKQVIETINKECKICH